MSHMGFPVIFSPKTNQWIKVSGFRFYVASGFSDIADLRLLVAIFFFKAIWNDLENIDALPVGVHVHHDMGVSINGGTPKIDGL